MPADGHRPGDAPSTVAVETLTDEELDVLAGGSGIVVTPYLDQHEEAFGQRSSTRAAVLRTAYRGLIARGIVDPPTAEAVQESLHVGSPGQQRDGDGEPTIDVMVRSDVRAVVTLRRAARTVVAVARTTAVSQDFWYAHVVDDVTLIEEVDSDGLHRFALTETAALPQLVYTAVVHPELADDTPPGSAPESGSGAESADVIAVAAPYGSQPDPTPPVEILERLGAATLRSDVVVRTLDDVDPPLLGVFSGPAGAWCLESRAGAGVTVSARRVPAESVRARIGALLDGAAGVERGRRTVDPGVSDR